VIQHKTHQLYQNHRFDEVQIIRHIHEYKDIPGVVHIAHSQAILRDDHSPVCSGDRHKTRVCLSEYGKPFMDLKTPLEVLIVIYDLLESESEFYGRESF
jgi:hypothetical protein